MQSVSSHAVSQCSQLCTRRRVATTSTHLLVVSDENELLRVSRDGAEHVAFQQLGCLFHNKDLCPQGMPGMRSISWHMLHCAHPIRTLLPRCFRAAWCWAMPLAVKPTTSHWRIRSAVSTARACSNSLYASRRSRSRAASSS